jgi:hypothetical protein
MDADFCRAVAAAEANRPVVPRDEVVIMDEYECNRQMGREEKYK